MCRLIIFCMTVGLFAQGVRGNSLNEAFDEIMAAGGEDDFNEFGDLDLNALMNINVTSVAGVKQGWFQTPAAMYVITNEDVRRSGHRQLPEALRLAPGLAVARIDSNVWKIGSRGLGQRFSGHLLVLIDGRSVFTPLFSGVWWDMQDVLLEDLDRIEIIRGPGATLWGANAVNGVINITTRSAKDTQGWYLTGGAGTYERGFGAVRYGGQIADNIYFRVYGKYDSIDTTVDSSGEPLHSDWEKPQAGFRFDIEGDDGYTMTIHGDGYYSEHIGYQYRLPVVAPVPTMIFPVTDDRIAGANLLYRLNKVNEDGSHWEFQTYYDRTSRKFVDGINMSQDNVDIDFRHHFILDKHQLMWGMAYRFTHDQITPGVGKVYVPNDRTFHTFSGFLQDTITLVDERLFLMLGSKFEHNNTTGFEIQPSARLWWTPNERHTLWGAVSRPIRTPSRVERDLILAGAYIDSGLLMGGPPSGVIVPLGFTGNPDINSEEMLAFEAGYRTRLIKDVTLDLALYYNDYRKMSVFPAIGTSFENDTQGETYGVEVAANWQVASNWRMEGSYTFNRVHIHGVPGTSEDLEGGTPQHQFQVRSYLNITEDLELNTALYYVDNVPVDDAPSYFRLDMGVTWRPTENIEVAVWGQNLLDESHRESNDLFILAHPVEVPRGVYGQVTLRY